MITAWQVYLVMQLDNIRDVLGVCTVILGVSLLFGGAFGAFVVSEMCGDRQAGCWKMYRRLVSTGMVLFSLLLICTTFIPSSKTVAAMIVLPAITSETVIDNVTPEAKELYGLAKEALKNLGAKDKPVDPEKAK